MAQGEERLGKNLERVWATQSEEIEQTAKAQKVQLVDGTMRPCSNLESSGQRVQQEEAKKKVLFHRSSLRARAFASPLRCAIDF